MQATPLKVDSRRIHFLIEAKSFVKSDAGGDDEGEDEQQNHRQVDLINPNNVFMNITDGWRTIENQWYYARLDKSAN